MALGGKFGDIPTASPCGPKREDITSSATWWKTDSKKVWIPIITSLNGGIVRLYPEKTWSLPPGGTPTISLRGREGSDQLPTNQQQCSLEHSKRYISSQPIFSSFIWKDHIWKLYNTITSGLDWLCAMRHRKSKIGNGRKIKWEKSKRQMRRDRMALERKILRDSESIFVCLRQCVRCRRTTTPPKLHWTENRINCSVCLPCPWIQDVCRSGTDVLTACYTIIDSRNPSFRKNFTTDKNFARIRYLHPDFSTIQTGSLMSSELRGIFGELFWSSQTRNCTLGAVLTQLR
jgi:hypothetical protein